MAEQIGGLFASLTLEMGPFLQNAAQAQSTVARVSGGIRRELGVMDRSVASFGRSAGASFGAAAAASRSLDTAASRVGLLRSTLLSATAAFGGFGAALTSNAVLRYATEAQKISNSFRSITDSAAAARAQTLAVFDSADRARAGVSATATLVTRMQRADPASNPAAIMRRAETIQKALAIGGATPAERNSVAIQISQGFSSGNFQGDELRAIRESPLSPFLAKALGVPIGQLKEMGAQGKLTAEVVSAALDKMASDVDARFRLTEATVDDVLTRVDNELTKVIGKLDTTYGGTRLLAGGLGYAADNMEMLVKAAAILATIFGSNFLARGLTAGGGAFARRIRASIEENKAAAATANDALAATKKQQADATKALSNASVARSGDPFRSAPGSQQSAYLRAAQQAKRIDTDILSLQQRLADQRAKTSAITATTTARAVVAAEGLIKAEARLSETIARRASIRRQIEAGRGMMANYAPGSQDYRAIEGGVARQQAALKRAADQEIKERERVAAAKGRVLALETAAEQRAATARVESIRREREIEAGIAQARAQRGTASMQTLMLGSVAKQTGSASAASAFKEAQDNLNAINKKLGEHEVAAAKAARGITVWGKAVAGASAVGMSFVNFLGGWWGLGLTAAGVAAAAWGAKTAEAAQKVVEARRIIDETLPKIAERGGEEGARAEQSILRGQIDAMRERITKAQGEAIAARANVSSAFASAMRSQTSVYGGDPTLAALDPGAAALQDAAIKARDLAEQVARGDLEVSAFITTMNELAQKAPGFEPIAKAATDAANAASEAVQVTRELNKQLDALIAKRTRPSDVTRAPLAPVTGDEYGNVDGAARRLQNYEDEYLRKARLTADQADIEARTNKILEDGVVKSRDKAKALAEQAQAAAKAAAETGKLEKIEERQNERTETILARIRNRSAGSFLSDLDRRTLQETSRLPNADKLQQRYIDARSRGGFAGAPQALLDVRAQLQIEEQAEVFREIVKEWGSGEQVAGQLNDRLQILNALVAQGRISVEQGAKAWKSYVAEMSPAARLSQDLQFERQQLGRSDIEQNVYSRMESAGLPDANGEITGAQNEMIANQIRFNEALKQTQDAYKGLGADAVEAAKKGDLKGFGKSILDRTQNLVEGRLGTMIDDGISQMISNAAGAGPLGGLLGKEAGALGSSAANAMWVQVVGAGGALPYAPEDVTRNPLAAIAGNDNAVAKAFGANGAFSFAGNYKRGVDPRLTDILSTAAERSGLKVEAFSGLRPGDPRFHGRGMATDIRLFDPATGAAIPNYQDAGGFRAYEQFAQQARAVQIEKYPGLAEDFRWGGYFAGGKGKYGALDTMHFDLGGRKVGMGGGSWQNGLTPGMRAAWPGANSVGMSQASTAQVQQALTGLQTASQQAAAAIPTMTQGAATAAPALGGLGQQATGLGGIFQNLFSGLGGAGGGGGFSSFIGSIFGGAFAAGTPSLPSNKLNIVGEKGPELLWGNKVLSNRQLMELSQPTVNVPQFLYQAPKNDNGGGKTEVHVHNAPVGAETRESDDGRGNRRVDIVFPEQVANAMTSTPVRKAMRGGFGVQREVRRRG